MHVLIFVLAVLILSVLIHLDLRQINPVWGKKPLFFLIVIPFIALSGTLMSYWWMWMHHCPLFFRWELDSVSSLGLGVVSVFLLLVSATLLVRRQLKSRALLSLIQPNSNEILSQQIQDLVVKIKMKQPPPLFLRDMDRMFAATLSPLKPIILLSNVSLESLDPEELESVLIHELFHIKRNDLLLTSCARLIRDLLWFLPGMNTVYQKFLHAVEYQADAETIKITGKPGAMASALLKFEKSLTTYTLAKDSLHFFYPYPVMGLGFLSEEEDMNDFQRRLTLLLDDHYSSSIPAFFPYWKMKTVLFTIIWLIVLWGTPYCHILY